MPGPAGRPAAARGDRVVFRATMILLMQVAQMLLAFALAPGRLDACKSGT
jgi:hypothetical protein